MFEITGARCSRACWSRKARALGSWVRTPFVARIYVHVLSLCLCVNVSFFCITSPTKRLIHYIKITIEFEVPREVDSHITMEESDLFSPSRVSASISSNANHLKNERNSRTSDLTSLEPSV
jgi:hypothetical protein